MIFCFKNVIIVHLIDVTSSFRFNKKIKEECPTIKNGKLLSFFVQSLARLDKMTHGANQAQTCLFALHNS